MSKLSRRQRQAAVRGFHAFRRGSWPIYGVSPKRWDVYVESEGTYILNKRTAVIETSIHGKRTLLRTPLQRR